MRSRIILGIIVAAVVAELAVWGLGQMVVRPIADHRAVTRPVTLHTATGQFHLGRGWHLKLSASFTGAHLNTALWATCYPWMDVPTGCTNFSNLRSGVEHEWYLPSQVRVRNGELQLVAQRIPVVGQNFNGRPRDFSCRSGMVTTYPGFRFKYGYLNIVAHIPSNVGLWPALWLAAANRHWPPEIDLLEHWGAGVQRTWLFFHPLGGARQGHHLDMPNLFVGWHSFGLNWTPSKLSWYVDGRLVFSTRRHIPHQKMYLIANLAESQMARPGWGCNGTMSIRSVRVWQQK